MVFRRAICVFGTYTSSFYDNDDSHTLSCSSVQENFERIEDSLEKEGKPLVEFQAEPLPYIRDGIITDSNGGSSYLFNNCFVANLYVPGNGFNFAGVYHTLVSIGFSEEEIQKTFFLLKNRGKYECLSHWKENPKFSRDIDIPLTERSLESVLRIGSKLLLDFK